MGATSKPRLTPEQKIAALEQEIADRKAAAAERAKAVAGAKKHELLQVEERITLSTKKLEELEGWFHDNNIDIESTVAVAPVKREKPATPATPTTPTTPAAPAPADKKAKA